MLPPDHIQTHWHVRLHNRLLGWCEQASQLLNQLSYGHWLLLVLGSALVLQLPLLFNPGYFSHDELQWAARANVATVAELPWLAWFDLETYQYRPLTFNLWLWASYHGFAHPWLFHAMLVVWGLINTVLLALIARRLGLSAAASWILAVLFVTSPYAMYVHGWVATMADLLVMSALLLLVWGVVSGARVWVVLVLSMVLTAVALMSKESAMAIPAILGVVWLFDGFKKKWLVACVASGLVAVAYLYLRLPVLMQQPEGTHYSLGFWHAPWRWLEYHLYWVTPIEVEPHTTTSKGWRVPPVLAALLVMGFWLVMWRSSKKAMLALLAGGVALLLPVLPIASSAAQYGYLFAAWCLLVVVMTWPRVDLWGRYYLVLLGGLSAIHGLVIMLVMVYTGMVQSVYSPALAQRVAQHTGDEPLRLQLTPATRVWIFYRLTHQIHSYKGIEIEHRAQIVDAGEATDYYIQPDGRITEEPSPD